MAPRSGMAEAEQLLSSHETRITRTEDAVGELSSDVAAASTKIDQILEKINDSTQFSREQVSKVIELVENNHRMHVTAFADLGKRIEALENIEKERISRAAFYKKITKPIGTILVLIFGAFAAKVGEWMYGLIK